MPGVQRATEAQAAGEEGGVTVGDDMVDAMMLALKATTAPEDTFHNYDCGEVGGGWPHPASAHDLPDPQGQCMDDPSYDPLEGSR